MKTIGIITLHTPINYGSCLQTVATSEFVRSQGYSPTVIDYHYPTPYHLTLAKAYNAPKHPWTLWRKLKNKVAKPFTEKKINGENGRKINEFYGKYIKLTCPYKSSDELLRNPPLFDVYMTGSDQVWNPKFMGDDTTYLLSWVPKEAKRISYSSSMSVIEMPDKYKKLYATYLERFDHISTRETPTIAEQLSGKSCQMCLDPTFLLSKDDWAQYTAKEPLVEGKYILCYLLEYMFSPFPYAYDVIRKIKKETGYKVIMIGGNPEEIWKGIFPMPNCGPEEFLNLFLHASIVITSSFHGSAFAINFGKPFITIVNDKSTLDNRQVTLASLVGIQDKVVLRKNSDLSNFYMPEYDITAATNRLELLREKSRGYLIRALRN